MGSKTINIDIVIPSARVSFSFLHKIISLPQPENLSCTFIIIIDNPNKHITEEFDTFLKGKEVTVLRNDSNLGASLTRNRGIDFSTAKWILFLDDDIIPKDTLLFEYLRFIESDESSNYLGAIGKTDFPEPINSFTNGILSSQILTFFGISSWYKSLKWGTTSNILINREKIGSIRFLSLFPKNGGGEDIDFFLRIGYKWHQEFKTIPNAQVTHPWWNNGKRSYRRFFRWAYGDSMLPKLHQDYKYYNFPNYVEICFLTFIPFVTFYSLWETILLFLLFFIGNTIVEFNKIWAQQNKTNITYAIESTIIRTANNLGRVMGNLRRGDIFSFSERFDYFCDGKHIRTERYYEFCNFIITLIILLCYSIS